MGREIDIIHLNGSIEIAPILGLSDVIVDIVETIIVSIVENTESKQEYVATLSIANCQSPKANHQLTKRKYARNTSPLYLAALFIRVYAAAYHRWFAS